MEAGTLHIPEEGLAESCHSEVLPKRDRPQYTFVVLLQLMSFQCTESDSYLDCKNTLILTRKKQNSLKQESSHNRCDLPTNESLFREDSNMVVPGTDFISPLDSQTKLSSSNRFQTTSLLGLMLQADRWDSLC